ncbi:HEAT repeat domain-containing protein [bacterium]|nr:HEAT repeat domain-containing protein [bacterium]
MNLWQSTATLALVASVGSPAYAGWPELPLWKSSADPCVTDTCVDEPCLQPSCALPESCLDTCVDGCVDGCIDDCAPSPAARLAQLIHKSQTACEPRGRKAALERIAGNFDCKCYPEVLNALAYGLKDCDARVRLTAADEIGDQIRENGCCCNSYVTSRLICALEDSSGRVRRQAAQALRECGYKIEGCAEYGYRNICGPDGCVDSCVDGCVEGYVDAYIPQSVEHTLPAESWPAPADKPRSYGETREDAPLPMSAPQARPVLPMPDPKPMPMPMPEASAPPARLKAPAAAPAPKKSYVPEEESTGFRMPSFPSRELLGFGKTRDVK